MSDQAGTSGAAPANKDLRESTNAWLRVFMADQVPTERESNLIYQMLMDDYLTRFNVLGSIGMLAAGELDIGDAKRRFKRIAWLPE